MEFYIETASAAGLDWVKSSYSGNNGNCVELASLPSHTASAAGLDWVKSSYSGDNGDCVEVGSVSGNFALRDSKNPHGPALMFAAATLDAFVQGVATRVRD